MNRFKGLDLIESLKNYGHVQQVVTKISPEKKKCKKAKWLSEEVLAEKRRDVKDKGEMERYTQLKVDSREQQGEIRKPS